MSFDKYYFNRKDWLGKTNPQPGCRPHGACKYCTFRRLYNFRKDLEKTNQELNEFRINEIRKYSEKI